MAGISQLSFCLERLHVFKANAFYQFSDAMPCLKSTAPVLVVFGKWGLTVGWFFLCNPGWYWAKFFTESLLVVFGHTSINFGCILFIASWRWWIWRSQWSFFYMGSIKTRKRICLCRITSVKVKTLGMWHGRNKVYFELTECGLWPYYSRRTSEKIWLWLWNEMTLWMPQSYFLTVISEFHFSWDSLWNAQA